MQRNSVNRVMLVGHLGSDARLSTTPNGTSVAHISLATNTSRRDGDGNWIEETEWHRITLYGKLADFARDYLKKGTLVYVGGRLHTRTWEDNQKNTHYLTEVIGQEVTLLGPRRQAEAPPAISEATEEAAEEDIPV